MGLLSVASGKKNVLLSKAQSASSSKISFQEWAEDRGFEHCGVFAEKSGIMLLEFAYGLDAQTVFRSISTKDFWLGSARSNAWITLDSESPNFTAFTQFLGPEARGKVKSFRILKIDDKGGLLVFFECSYKPAGLLRVSENFAQELKNVLAASKQARLEKPTIYDTSSLAELGKARLCLIATKRALDETTKSIEVSELTIQKILINTVFDEIFFKTKKLFASPAAIYAEDSDEIKTAAFINSDVEDEILKEQLSLEFESVIGSDAAKKTIILTAGYSSDSEEILDYLLRG